MGSASPLPPDLSFAGCQLSVLRQRSLQVSHVPIGATETDAVQIKVYLSFLCGRYNTVLFRLSWDIALICFWCESTCEVFAVVFQSCL